MQRTLTSLALVTALWEKRGTDYLDNFVPFIGTLAARKGLSSISSQEIGKVCELFSQEFGLTIPYHPMISILNPCRRRGLLRKIELGYQLDLEAIARTDFSVQERQFSDKVRAIVQGFGEYAKRIYEVDVDATLAEDLVVEMLRRSDMEILFASHDARGGLPRLQLSSKHRKFEHILNRYILELHRNNPGSFRQLADIAVGHIITNTISPRSSLPSDSWLKSCCTFPIHGADSFGPTACIAHAPAGHPARQQRDSTAGGWFRQPHLVRLAPEGWKRDHPRHPSVRVGPPEEPPPQMSVSAKQSRAAWARLIKKVYDADLSG